MLVFCRKKNVRDRVSLLVPPMDLSKFTKYIVWKCLLNRSINVERIPPAKCGYEHVFCFRLIEVPGIYRPSSNDQLSIRATYLALKNFISRTLTRAFLGLMGSIVTPHIVYGVDPACGLSGNAIENV